MSLHKSLTIGDIHLPYQWSYANAAAREGATGFTSLDIGKFARQLDDNSIWMLIATTPTWTMVSSAGGVVAHASTHKGGGTDVIDNATTSLAGLMSASDKTRLDGISATKERFFQVDPCSDTGNYRACTVTGTGEWNFVLVVPVDFVSLVSVEAIGIPAGDFTDKGIDLFSSYGAVGESVIQHQESDTTPVVSGTGSQFFSLNLASVLTQIAAGDVCGIKIDNINVGVNINWIGIRLRYL